MAQQQFQTTFIPKQPAAGQLPPQKGGRRSVRRRTPINLFSLLGIIILVASIGAAAAAFFSHAATVRGIEADRARLAAEEKQFERKTIMELQELDHRLNVSAGLLSNHLSVAPLFRLLEKRTLKEVAFTAFTFTSDPEAGEFADMKGVAKNYRTIAEQSAIFGESPFIRDHLFSSFELLETAQVAFNLTATFNADLIKFEDSIESFTFPEDEIIPEDSIVVDPVAGNGQEIVVVDAESETDIEIVSSNNTESDSAFQGN